MNGWWGASIALLAIPGGAVATNAFTGVPHVTMRPYEVRGEDGAALRRSIDAARPTDPHGDQPVDALTHWRMSWRWPGKRHGRCDLSHVQVSFRAEVTLPRLAEGVTLPPPLADVWARYTEALEQHEARHVRYAYDHRRDVLAAIRRARCATADRAARAALAAIVAHDVAFDRDTRHGMNEGATFP